MQNNNIQRILVLILISIGQSTQLCQRLSTNFHIFDFHQTECYQFGQCQLFYIQNHSINIQKQTSIFQFHISSNSSIQIQHNHSIEQISIFLISKITNQLINQTNLFVEDCYDNQRFQRSIDRFDSPTSVILTFNSSSFIDYRSKTNLDYPLRLSVHFRTIGRISNGVLLSLTHRKTSSIIYPFLVLEHTNGKIELTILKLDERSALSKVTTVQCGKNVNNDNWHFLQFDIDQNGIFTLVVDDDSQTSQIPAYVVSSWHLNAVLVGDTRRLNTDIFQPFIGYMTDLIFNDEYLFTSLTKRKDRIKLSFTHVFEHILVGYRIAFFNFVTINTQQSYIAFSERENQNKNHGKLDIYFLFRTYISDGIILYRNAQGLNEYFTIGLRSGILALFIDFGFGKRQILSDETIALSDGKWHEVRVTRFGYERIELSVDNRVNRSTLSTNGIRNAVSLQPVFYVGGIPHGNNINLTGLGFNSYGFQGCLASFIVDGRLLDYQTALVLHGQVKIDVCSDPFDITSLTDDDLTKLCYDFTCFHSGICISTGNDGSKCDCLETGYTGERCDKLPFGYYFGKSNNIGWIDYILSQSRQTEHDLITFGLQTTSSSIPLFRLESDLKSYFLEYEIIHQRSYLKLNFDQQQPDVYSVLTTSLTDGNYHSIKIQRKFRQIQLFIDEIKIELERDYQFENSSTQEFLQQRRLRIGNFRNHSKWNGIIAGLTFNRQSIFDSLSTTVIRKGDVTEVYPNLYTGQFQLINSSMNSNLFSTIPPIDNLTLESTTIPIFLNENIEILSAIPINRRSTIFHWFSKQTKHFGLRSLLISLLLASCFLLFLLFIILRLYLTNRQRRQKKTFPFKSTTQANGRTYSQLHHQSKRYSIAPPDGRDSKKRVPKFLRYLHTNEAKPTSFRLSTNDGDSYHLISSIQDTKTLPYRNSDCVLNEHCCIHSSLSQPVASSSSSSSYQQVNRLMLSGSDPPLPLPNLSQTHSHHQNLVGTIRSIKKDIDNSSAQTYSAVYSCDLAANLDLNQDILAKQTSSIKRRSILKNTNSSLIQTKVLFLYMKNLVDCYAIQSINRTTTDAILLATADENRVQLSQAFTGSFHMQLPLASAGSCHNLFFSYNGQYLIGLFYEITSNLNPYAVKIWSLDDYLLRTNVHPIKCSIALTSRHSSILYMAGKQKYGRGISLGLLDIDTCTLIRELKSDPDTSIGDEIQRIILTKNESYALVACTEHTSLYTCFVVFKLEILGNDQLTLANGSMTNCTMILTRFDSNPNHTFSINDDQQILTILRTNQILIWKLNDGEILFNYDFHHLNNENKIQQILNCQMNNNRLLILLEHGTIHIWDVTLIMNQFSLISTIADPLISSLSWLDQRHFISIDHDYQRLRVWNIYRKDVIHELISNQGLFQTLNVHSITNKRQEYLITGKSINERNLLLFEYTQPADEQIDSANITIC